MLGKKLFNCEFLNKGIVKNDNFHTLSGPKCKILLKIKKPGNLVKSHLIETCFINFNETYIL